MAGLLVGFMFNLLRQLERWLHQHVFKVGWLITKNFQTTTILYYTFFLPGVILYEFVYWLAAGILNVHAERSIQWPEKQEIGELRLNFVRLSRRANPLKVALISLAPLAVGLFVVWFIANNIFHLDQAISILAEGRLRALGDALKTLTSAPDFWLWAYFLFAVSNTMTPDLSQFKNWRRWFLIVIAVASVPLFVIGVGDEIWGQTLTGPVATVFNTLSGIFAIIIVSNAVAVAILGTIEAMIEWITGDSATFRNGKMIVMTRAEAIAQRRQQRERSRRGRQRQPAKALGSGPPSIYRRELPIPGTPGQELVTQAPSNILTDEKPKLTPSPQKPAREVPSVIISDSTPSIDEPPEQAQPIEPPPTDDDAKEKPSQQPRPAAVRGARPATLPRSTAPKSPVTSQADAEDEPSQGPATVRGIRPAGPSMDAFRQEGNADIRNRLAAMRQQRESARELVDDEGDELTYEDVDD